MPEQRNSADRPSGEWRENGKSPGAGEPDDAEGAAAGKPSDDRLATEMAALLTEKEDEDPAEERPSDTETPRDPA